MGRTTETRYLNRWGIATKFGSGVIAGFLGLKAVVLGRLNLRLRKNASAGQIPLNRVSMGWEFEQ